MNTEKIPESVEKLKNEYANLTLGNKRVTAPYYINDKRRKDLRAMVGKGTPEEIIVEARIWEKLKGVDFNSMSEDQIKEFLMSKGIGIDCSGFVIHLMNTWFKEKTGKSIWGKLTPLKQSPIWRLRYNLRPAENMGADIMTDDDNSVPVDLNDLRPGDLIRSKAKKNNGHHVMLVSETNRDDSGNLLSFKYIHSSPYFGKENGIREGEIKITDINKPLQDQEWLEADENGVKHTLEGYLVNVEDNGPRRLKCFL